MLDKKVKELLSKLESIENQLGSPEVFSDQNLYRELTQEHARLTQLKESWDYFQRSSKQLIENQDLLLTEKDPELIEVIREEIDNLKAEAEKTQKKIEQILVPPDPRDSRNIIMELRAGTGGDEAALFVGDCVRMYKLYADKMKWKIETLSSTPSEVGGFKEYIMTVTGENVFRFMQYEAGTHRVQRVPETETQGRLHTSAITVAVYLEPTEDEKVDIDEKDLQIDTYRASGAGGQHVNTTDSAVRITHVPSGIVVTCQDERSQHKNKEKAMRYLMAKLTEQKIKEQQKELADLRASQVGSGDRSERIRTYNFPQNRISDHRIGLTLYNLDQVMEGELEDISQSLVSYYYQQKFA